MLYPLYVSDSRAYRQWGPYPSPQALTLLPRIPARPAARPGHAVATAFARRAEVATPRWPKILRSAPPDGEFALSRCRDMNKPREKTAEAKVKINAAQHTEHQTASLLFIGSFMCSSSMK